MRRAIFLAAFFACFFWFWAAPSFFASSYLAGGGHLSARQHHLQSQSLHLPFSPHPALPRSVLRPSTTPPFSATQIQTLLSQALQRTAATPTDTSVSLPTGWIRLKGWAAGGELLYRQTGSKMTRSCLRTSTRAISNFKNAQPPYLADAIELALVPWGVSIGASSPPLAEPTGPCLTIMPAIREFGALK